MTYLSDFKRGQIVDARTADSSVTKSVELFGVARSTVSKEMTAFEKEGKTSTLKLKLSDGDHWTLTQIVRKDHKNIAPTISAELNDHLKNPVSSETVRRRLHKVGFHGDGELQ